MTIARGVLKAMAHANIRSLRELAEKSGLSPAYLSRVAGGLHGNPSLVVLVKIAQACGVPASRLLAWAEEE